MLVQILDTYSGLCNQYEIEFLSKKEVNLGRNCGTIYTEA